MTTTTTTVPESTDQPVPPSPAGDETAPRTSPLRVALALVLLAAGLFTWWKFGRLAGLGVPRIAWLVVVGVLALIPRTRELVADVLDYLRTPPPRRRTIIALGFGVAAVVYLVYVAHAQGRDFIPRFHDEHMHLMQVRMLAHGKLWTPPHELADFFDTFHIIVRPVHASIYFPGTALLYVPSVWLGLPAWVLPVLAAGATVALLYRVITELVDGVAGLLAPLLLLSLQMFRFLSIKVMSHSVIVLLALAMVWAYLNWRRTRSLAWAAVLGAFAGWAAITRPFDAIAYTLPVAVAVLIGLRAIDRWPRRIATIAVICVAAVPFIGLQLVENVGVTGKLLQTPYQFYAEQDSPQLHVGYDTGGAPQSPREAAASLQSTLPQKREFYVQFLGPGLERHRTIHPLTTLFGRRLPMVVYVTLFTALLLIPLPLFVLARGAGRAAVMWAMPPIYLLLYTAFPFLLKHYAMVVAPAMALMVLLGLRALIETLVPARARRGVEVFLVLFLAGIAIPPLKPDAPDDGYPLPAVTFAEKLMPRLIKPPAIVLFRYAPGGNFHDEPVYNTDVVNPDDAPIIRAQDLGPERNRQLYDYYAKRQPNRTVYHFDRTAGKLTTLGNVAEIARNPDAAVIPPPTTNPTTTNSNTSAPPPPPPPPRE